MEEEYNISDNLGRLIEVFLRQWQLILAMTLIAGITAGAASLLLTKEYQASVLLASTKSASTVSYEPSIITLVEEQLLRGVSKARLQSYVNLVKNPLIAQEVLDKMGDQLDEQYRSVEKLLNSVEGELIRESDTIEITITYSDPELAAQIVNEWAKVYMTHINNVYLESGSGEVYSSIKVKLDESKGNYNSAQRELEEFIAINQQEEYTRQIAETQLVIDQLSSIRVNVLSQQINNLDIKLEEAYDKRRNVDQLLNNASDIRAQVSRGGGGAVNSNAIALNLLKAQAFAPGTESVSRIEYVSTTELVERTESGDLIIQTSPIIQTNPNQQNSPIIQTSVINTTAEVMIDDLDGFIEVLENRRDKIDEEIDILSTQIVSDYYTFGDEHSQPESTAAENQAPLELIGSGQIDFNMAQLPIDQTILDLEKRIDDLGAKLAQETDRHDELMRARDLAWETYQTLANKEAELNVAAEIPGSVVNIASTALIPEKDTVSTIKNTALATAMGLIIGTFTAFAIEFWWGYKGIEPHPIINFRLKGNNFGHDNTD